MADHRRQADGEVVGVYPSPLVLRFADKASRCEWIARTVGAKRLGARLAAPKWTPAAAWAGRAPVDVPPNSASATASAPMATRSWRPKRSALGYHDKAATRLITEAEGTRARNAPGDHAR
ncbi:hypothetical protein [Streptomyces lavendulae]|uniref:hypothetical protein n=1 Tax=Streptomyces lavendulae TaxID=1914 RepID=UPI0031EA9320